mgnify:CR=1 FL=1
MRKSQAANSLRWFRRKVCPGLRPPRVVHARHVPGDGGLAYLVPEHSELGGDPRRAPGRVLHLEAPDEAEELPADLGAPLPMTADREAPMQGKPWRCQRTTVAGVTRCSQSRQPS